MKLSEENFEMLFPSKVETVKLLMKLAENGMCILGYVEEYHFYYIHC